jgi:outer membrane protein assembly factor BamB
MLLLTAGVVLAGVGSLGLLTNRPPPAPADRVVWTFEQPQRGAIISSPLVTDDRVYVAAVRDLGPASFGAVCALDRATGKRLWDFDAGSAMRQTYSSPCLDSGRLYLGEGMHGNHVCTFYCLDADSGRERWHFKTSDHIESSPCAADGKVFFGAGDDGVWCLDAATGKECWHFAPPIHVDASPIVVAGRLYVGSGVTNTRNAPGMFCLDAATGQELWHVATDLPVWGTAAADGDRVFVPLGNGRLLESADHPAGALLCLDLSGHQQWRCPVGDGVLARPTLDAGHVYFGSRDGGCTCLDRDGQLCWRTDMGGPVVTRAALDDGRLYVLPVRGPVTCLDARSGKALWTFDLAAYSQTTPRLLSSPAVRTVAEGAQVSRRIYFGTELQNGVTSAAVLYCLRD